MENVTNYKREDEIVERLCNIIKSEDCSIVWALKMLGNSDRNYLESAFPYTFPILSENGSLTKCTRHSGGAVNFVRRQYYVRVWKSTLKNLQNLPDLHIDHIVPILLGYHLQLPPELIGSKENLRYLEPFKNLDKNSKITADSIRIIQGWKLGLKRGTKGLTVAQALKQNLIEDRSPERLFKPVQELLVVRKYRDRVAKMFPQKEEIKTFRVVCNI